jgi:hypothetical protein
VARGAIIVTPPPKLHVHPAHSAAYIEAAAKCRVRRKRLRAVPTLCAALCPSKWAAGAPTAFGDEGVRQLQQQVVPLAPPFWRPCLTHAGALSERPRAMLERMQHRFATSQEVL